MKKINPKEYGFLSPHKIEAIELESGRFYIMLTGVGPNGKISTGFARVLMTSLNDNEKWVRSIKENIKAFEAAQEDKA